MSQEPKGLVLTLTGMMIGQNLAARHAVGIDPVPLPKNAKQALEAMGTLVDWTEHTSSLSASLTTSGREQFSYSMLVAAANRNAIEILRQEGRDIKAAYARELAEDARLHFQELDAVHIRSWLSTKAFLLEDS